MDEWPEQDQSIESVSRRSVLAALALVPFMWPEDSAAATLDIKDFLRSYANDESRPGNAEIIIEHEIRTEELVFETPMGRITCTLFSANADNPPPFFLPHDNEDIAFDAALRAIADNGGSFLRVNSGGFRNLKVQRTRLTKRFSTDPNRVFDTEHPLFENFGEPLLKHLYGDSLPIVALHANHPVGAAKLSNFASRKDCKIVLPEGKSYNQGTYIWMAVSRDDTSTTLTTEEQSMASELQAKGIPVVVEFVQRSGQLDSSLSQFAGFHRRPYFNIEIEQPVWRAGMTKETFAAAWEAAVKRQEEMIRAVRDLI